MPFSNRGQEFKIEFKHWICFKFNIIHSSGQHVQNHSSEWNRRRCPVAVVNCFSKLFGGVLQSLANYANHNKECQLEYSKENEQEKLRERTHPQQEAHENSKSGKNQHHEQNHVELNNSIQCADTPGKGITIWKFSL